ncbi:transposable element Tcb2 transposase [Trichonephila clavipes]|nr:transposable element Tcb2 transposase [Trichonephila clavipes]
MKPRFHRVFCQRKAQEHIEDSQRNITSCRNEVGTLGTKDEEVTAEMDKGIMVADSFRSNRSVVPKCQLTRSVRIKDRSSSTPVARPELPFEVENMDLIGPIDPPSFKGHKYILRLVDQHTRWGEAVPLTSLSANVTCEAWLNIFSRTEIYLLSKREGFVEKNSAASWVTVLDLWKWYFCRSLTKGYATCVMPFDIYMTKKVRFKIEYTSCGCNLMAKVLRMLEQFVVSRIVDIDILMQIWKNRVKQINFVLEWVRWVGSEIIPAKGKLDPRHLDAFTRGRIIGKLEEHRSVTSVAAEFGIAHSIVSRLWRQFQTTGTAIRGFSSGRPRGTTPTDDRYIVLQARRTRWQTAGEIARHTTQATGRPISRFTVARRLHGGDLFARCPVRCVPLTPAHRRRRSLWCREHRNWGDNEWGRVLFTDESRFSLSSDSHRILIWRERGSRNHPSNVIERDRYEGRGVLVWGGIRLGSRTDLHIFDAGSVNGTRYCNEILLPYVHLFRGAMGLQFLFIDDNAPCHRTVAAEQLLESRRLGARTLPPVMIRELRLALQVEWAAMPQQLIDTLILSIGRRCETCLAVRGEHTLY